MDLAIAPIARRTAGTVAAVARVGRHVVAPAAGTVYLALWIVAEAGRWELAPKIVMFALFAVAIGLSVWMPVTALGLVVVVPLLQNVGVVAPPEDTTWPTYLAIAIVVGFAAMRGGGLVRWFALPAGALAVLLGAYRMTIPAIGDTDRWGSWVGGGSGAKHDLLEVGAAMFGAVALCWGIGIAVGSAWRVLQTSRALGRVEHRLAATDFELRIAQDRARIARDVHDSLAHSLAIVVSQAQGAAALAAASGSGVQTDALDEIAAVSRTALSDVRRLVERITQDDDETEPRPSPANIPELVATMRTLGMRATVSEFGEPGGLGPSQGLAVYRIVQECLTNALKHGGPSSEVGVVLDWRGAGLALFVTAVGDDPLVPPGAPGVGIRGMEERARLAGGWLRAEPGDAAEGRGTFVTTAWFPGRVGRAPVAQSVGQDDRR